MKRALFIVSLCDILMSFRSRFFSSCKLTNSLSAGTNHDQASFPVSSGDKPHRKSRDSKSSVKEGEEEELMEESPVESPVKKGPTRMLDELFRKTTSTPSIYWLPLSEEEVRRVCIGGRGSSKEGERGVCTIVRNV